MRLRPLHEALIAVGLAGSAVAVLRLGFGDLDGLARAIDHAPQAFYDFGAIYVRAGGAILSTPEPVEGFFYPPVFALLMVPFAAVPMEVALPVWAALQLASVAALAWLAPPALGLGGPVARLSSLALVLASFPVVHGLSWGQISGPLMAMVLGAAALARRGHRTGPAVLLASGLAAKLYVAGLLPAFLGPRGWPAVVGAGAGAVILALVVPLGILGPDGTLIFYEQVADGLAERSPLIRQDLNSHHVAHVVARWTGTVGPSLSTPAWLARVAGGLATVGLSVLAGMRAWRGQRASALVITLLATPLWVPTSWPHYLAYLPACQLVLGAWALRPETPGARRVLWGGAAVLSVALSTHPAVLIAGDPQLYNAAGALLVADLVLLVAALPPPPVEASRERA